MVFPLLLLACTPPGAQAPSSPLIGPSADTGTAGGPPEDIPLDGWPLAPPAGAGLHTPFLARDPVAGHLYLSWGERGDDGFTRVYLAVSTDDGRSFSAPQQVSPEGQDATARWPEGPTLAVGPDHLYLAYGAHELGGRPYTIYVVTAPLPTPPSGTTPAALPMDFALATKVEQPARYESLSYPTLAVHPDGLAWLAMVAAPRDTGHVWVAREQHGWAIEDVTHRSPLSEPPCECCPPALGMDPSGRVLVGWRGDIDKNLFVAESNGTGWFSDHRKITDTDVSDAFCPQDGPQFLYHRGAMRMAWSDARPAAGRGYLSTEGPSGWTHEPILATWEGVQNRVGVVPDGDALLTHWDPAWGGASRMAALGSAASQGILVEGAGPLSELRAVPTPSGPLGVGVDEAGGLWAVRLAPGP